MSVGCHSLDFSCAKAGFLHVHEMTSSICLVWIADLAELMHDEDGDEFHMHINITVHDCRLSDIIGLVYLCPVCSFRDSSLGMHVYGHPHMCSLEKLSSDGRGSFVGWQQG